MRNDLPTFFFGITKKALTILILSVVVLSRAWAASDYLHTIGNRVYDENNTEVFITGVNWFGFETTDYVFHGLWARNMNDMLNQMAGLKFNVLRVPLSSEFIKKVRTGQTVKPGKSKINRNVNPDLVGKTSIEILDMAIAYCRTIGLKVILDMHRTPASGMIDLWYNSSITEEDWMLNWEWLAGRYGGNDAVIGADIFNEPHGVARWDGSNSAVDWRRAAQLCGNRVIAIEPNWLIFVEGVETPDGATYGWWGGNLRGAASYPVTLSRPDKLVYSPHEYGPAVYNQWWFHNGSFSYDSLMSEHWKPSWLFINDQADVHPLLIGEWGGREYDLASDSGRWFNYLVQLIANKKLNHTFWCWNPNSGDTGGVLNDDWTTVNWGKYNVILATLFGNGLGHTVGLGGGAPWPGFTQSWPRAVASTYDGNGVEPANAIDGNYSSRWSSTFNDNQWISIDFQSNRSFDGVTLTWEAAYGRAYEIQVSADGANWMTVAAVTDGDGGQDVVSFSPQTARYVKKKGVTRATSWGYSLYEFQINEVIPSIFPIVTESSYESADRDGRKAFDGSMGTRWASEWSDPQWIKADYGTETTFNKITIDWESAYGKSYAVEMSHNNFNWTPVYSTATGDGGQDLLTFEPVSARYVRLYGTERGTTYGYSIWEIKIEKRMAAVSNLALGRTAYASSIEDSGMEPISAFDGNISTRWASQWSDPQWLAVDLGSAKTVSQVTLDWEYASARSYKIQVSQDMSSWTDVYSTTTGDGGYDDITFPAVSVRYVRMYGAQRATTFGYSLWEMQVR